MKASVFLKNLKNLTKEDLIEIKGLGDVLAKNVLEFAESDRNNDLIKKFEKLETKDGSLNIKTKITSNTLSSLSNKVVCITGKFDMPRNEIREALEDQGAKVTSAVTNNTDYLLAGQESGSKLKKAQELGIKIVNSIEEVV